MLYGSTTLKSQQNTGCLRLMIFCMHDLVTGKHDFNSLEKYQAGDSANQATRLLQEMTPNRTICLIMDCGVSFNSNYFDALGEAFRDSNLAALYTDFEYESKLNSVRSRIRPPNWSPERFLSNDFLGPVFALDLALLDESAQRGKLTRTQLLLSCISEGLEVKLIDQVGYVLSTENLNLNIESRDPEVTEFLAD